VPVLADASSGRLRFNFCQGKFLLENRFLLFCGNLKKIFKAPE